MSHSKIDLTAVCSVFSAKTLQDIKWSESSISVATYKLKGLFLRICALTIIPFYSNFQKPRMPVLYSCVSWHWFYGKLIASSISWLSEHSMLLQLQCDPRPSDLQVHKSVVLSRCLIDHLIWVTVQPKLIVDGPLRGITAKCQASGYGGACLINVNNKTTSADNKDLMMCSNGFYWGNLAND